MQHKEQSWKHKESNEVIDNLTYRNLDQEHRSNFEELEPAIEASEITTNGVIDLDKIENTGSEVVTDPPVVNTEDDVTTDPPVVNTEDDVTTDPVITGAPFDEEL